MKNHVKQLLINVLIAILMLLLAGCASSSKSLLETALSETEYQQLISDYTPPVNSEETDLDQFPRVKAWIMSRTVVNENEKDYYGADLTQFPPKAREWIINEGFPKEKMEGQYMIDPQLKVLWNDDGFINFEASYAYGSGGSRSSWGQGAFWGKNVNLDKTYGKYAKYQTAKFKWDITILAENLLRNDPMFAEIIEFAMELADELEYDWRGFSGYRGPVKRTPNKRYAVCDGYANEVMQKALRLSSVQSVEKWTSPSHAWNVLRLTDGRTLYFDLTWFDNEHINETTGEIYQTDDYNWNNITFNRDLFRYSNVSYGTRSFTHAKGSRESVIRK